LTPSVDNILVRNTPDAFKKAVPKEYLKKSNKSSIATSK
jgi:hypothetical protein